MKTAYLTIDDAPSADFAQKVNLLDSLNIPTVFFCMGNLMEQRPQSVIDAIKRGFIIGNHSYDHSHFSALSVEECLSQIKKTDALLSDLYEQAGAPYQHKYFRFPYGDKGDLRDGDVFRDYTAEGKTRKEKIQAFLRELGYTQPTFADVTYTYY